MKIALVTVFTFVTLSAALAQQSNQPSEAEAVKAIYANDSLFWQAYNKCDVEAMMTFFTEDVEFYHDKGGPTFSSAKLRESMQTGLCGNSAWRLRREPVAGSVQAFPLKNYGGLISGEHIFFLKEGNKAEYLDGYGKFIQVWQYKDGKWKMSRILSFDHGPANEKLKK